ncbi:MAG: hypothetical protein JXB39_15770 [Deltaproteobacteria bacterium]|nr:hypothetical protein [Deltaproteobacteria bacterium]
MPPSSAARADRWRWVAVGLAAVFVVACSEDVEPVWEQFNATDDQVTIRIGVEDVLDPVSTTLYSSSGIKEVGSARVEPGGGPIGTEHRFVVEVDDAYEHKVGRATVRVQSPERGSDEYDMDADSADEGTWTTTLVSVGEEGETRDDTATFRLWYDVSDEASSSDDTGG